MLVLRRIFGPEKNEVREGRRMLHMEKLYHFLLLGTFH
jgi:hypothetical protein